MADFKRDLDFPIPTIVGEGSAQMVMLVRREQELFTDFIAREAKAQNLKVVVNASFVKMSYVNPLNILDLLRNKPFHPSEITANGLVIQQGKLLGGSDSEGKFNFSQNNCGDKFSVSYGNPPPSSCSAVGGIAPILVGGFPYGDVNLYKTTTPKDIPQPLIREVNKESIPYLIQKSNTMYGDYNNTGTGKVVIGYSKTRNTLFILCQPQPYNGGLTADQIKSLLIARSVSDAVFLDGSDSATLYYSGKFLAFPGEMKNRAMTVAVGFK